MKINHFPVNMGKHQMKNFLKNDTGFGRSLANQKLTGEELASRQLKKFGISMLVLAVSIGLYYLGFFGSVDGPLHPARIGEKLSRLGVTRIHLLITFIALFAVTLVWNWIYNLINRWMGKRFICLYKDKSGKTCGAAAKLQKAHGQKANAANRLFLCEKGHTDTNAQFLPVKKGKWDYTLCAAMLTVVCGIMFCIF